MQLSEHLFIMVMFSSVKSQSRYKRNAYVSLSSSFSTCPFQSTIVFQSVTGTQPHEQPCQTLACTQVTRSVHYELALTNAIHHTSDVSLLQASIKPCCDLTEHISFAPVMFTVLEIQATLQHFSQP